MINNKNDWLKEYRQDKDRVWYVVEIDDNIFYFHNYYDWFKIKELNKKINKISLQYRSNVVSKTFDDVDGCYLVRSIIGKPGVDQIINTITIGTIKGDEVVKTIYITPSLVERETYVDKISNCFKEAIIAWNYAKQSKFI